MSWWFENDMQQQEFISYFPDSITDLSKKSGVNGRALDVSKNSNFLASDFAEALMASEQLAVLYSYKLKALGEEDVYDFEGIFYPGFKNSIMFLFLKRFIRVDDETWPRKNRISPER